MAFIPPATHVGTLSPLHSPPGHRAYVRKSTLELGEVVSDGTFRKRAIKLVKKLIDHGESPSLGLSHQVKSTLMGC